MIAFDEYYNIESFPKGFLDEVRSINATFKAKYPNWGAQIDIVENEWPMKNMLRLNYGNLTLVQLSEIDTEFHRLFQRYHISFEMTSSGFSATEE